MQLSDTHLQWTAVCRDGCKTHNIREVDRGLVIEFRFHYLTHLQLLSNGTGNGRQQK